MTSANEINWAECTPASVRDGLKRYGVPYEVCWTIMCRLQEGQRAATDLRHSRERVQWLTSCLPETKHWPPSKRDPYGRAPADSDG